MLHITSDDRAFHDAVALAQAPRARSLMERMRVAIDQDPRAAHSMLDELSAVLGAPLAKEPASFAPTGSATPRGGLAAWQLRLVKAHIEENLARRIHVETLAKLARLSTSHFCRAFKISVGETAHNFIMKRRLERAQGLMLGSAESLCQIAAACGLADQAHLTRLFRRHTGETPFNWRRTYRTAAPLPSLAAVG
jgi:AraC family transcriptional regulator